MYFQPLRVLHETLLALLLKTNSKNKIVNCEKNFNVQPIDVNTSIHILWQ